VIDPSIFGQNFINQLDEPFLGCNHQNCFIFLLSINLGSLLKKNIDAIDMIINLCGAIAPLYSHMEHRIELPGYHLLLLAL